MTEIPTTRSATFALETRAADLAGRTLTTLAVPYGETSLDTPFPRGERFLPRAFRKAAQEFRGGSRKRPLYLFRSHDHSVAVGTATRLEDTPEGLVAEFRVAETPQGEAVLSEYRQGLLSSMSVGFRAIQDRVSQVDGAREILEASLLEASILPLGAYEGAGVLSLRAPAKPVDLSWVALPDPPKVDPMAPIGLWR